MGEIHKIDEFGQIVRPNGSGGFCVNCGARIPLGAKFCPECGTRVRVEPIEKDRTSGMDTCLKELEFVVGSCNFKMVKVDGGTFTMGATAEQSADAFPWERPAHLVTLSDYYIGQTEVTQALWKVVMGNNPSCFKDDNLPVERVNWYDCQTFIKILNNLLFKKLGGMRFALPTEAQWEFAARGGNESKGYTYAGSNDIRAIARYSNNSRGMTHPVAQKRPNELGLYDMSGNVREWCQDWLGSYNINAQTNPQGPADGEHRVIRGGGWNNSAGGCRVSARGSIAPDNNDVNLGLRLCLLP